MGKGGGGRGQFLSLRLRWAYIPNLSLLLCLERFVKFLVGGWVVFESNFSVQLRPKLNNSKTHNIWNTKNSYPILIYCQAQLSPSSSFSWLAELVLILLVELTRSYLCPSLGQKSLFSKTVFHFFAWYSFWKKTKSSFPIISSLYFLPMRKLNLVQFQLGQRSHLLR